MDDGTEIEWWKAQTWSDGNRRWLRREREKKSIVVTTMTGRSRRLENMLFMKRWNMVGVLVRPNGMTVHSNKPYLVWNMASICHHWRLGLGGRCVGDQKWAGVTALLFSLLPQPLFMPPPFPIHPSLSSRPLSFLSHLLSLFHMVPIPYLLSFLFHMKLWLTLTLWHVSTTCTGLSANQRSTAISWLIFIPFSLSTYTFSYLVCAPIPFVYKQWWRLL